MNGTAMEASNLTISNVSDFGNFTTISTTSEEPTTHDVINGSVEPGGATSSTTDQTATIIYITIGVIGTLSNLFSLTILCSSQHMRKKMVNMLLINQSAIDMATSVVMAANGPSVSNAMVSYSGLHGYFYCVFWASKLILWSLMLSSAYNLLCINIERYISIAFPLFHKVSLRRKHIYVMIALTWIFGPLEKGLFTLPTSAFRNNNCILASIWPNYTAKIFATVLNESLNFGVPVLITLVIYSHMAIILWRNAKDTGGVNANGNAIIGANAFKISNSVVHAQTSTRNPQQDQYHTKMSTAAKNILKTMATLTLCYLFCWSWNSVYFSLYIAGYTELKGSFYHFTVYILFLNSVINPFIYTAQYRAFRRQTMRLLLRKNVSDTSRGGSTFTADRSDTNEV